MHTLPLQALYCTFPALICLAQSVGQAGCLSSMLLQASALLISHVLYQRQAGWQSMAV